MTSAHTAGSVFRGVVRVALLFALGMVKLPAAADVPLSNVVEVVAGGAHACALLAGGAVRCWGWNLYGELGNGTRENAVSAVAVAGLESGVTALAAGTHHTCAVQGGAVLCWGRNDGGQLGNGTTQDALVPVAVSGLGAGATVLAAGEGHSCAVIAGGARCWGFNHDGQLGNGTLVDSPVPVAVTGLASGVTRLAGGWGHTCAVVAGSARCWGGNVFGELGDGTHVGSATPRPVQGLNAGVTAVAAGVFRSCAVANGATLCWGENGAGQLGDGTTTSSSVPRAALGLTAGSSAIAAGDSVTCAIVNGGAKCWGSNGGGQVGDGTTASTSTAKDVVGLGSGVTAIATGFSFACAVAGAGVRCWGDNISGALGNGTRLIETSPADVLAFASGVTGITAGWDHTCAVRSGGLWCWGWNGMGQLGVGPAGPLSAPMPQPVPSLAQGVTTAAAGAYHSCAVAGGALRCWGEGALGQLGNGASAASPSPVAVTGLGGTDVTAVTAGSNHTCAIVDGGARCWGYNEHGQLGNGTNTLSAVPVAVSGLPSGVTALSAGVHHTCAVMNGGVKCWGQNVNGELGRGNVASSNVPADVVGIGAGGGATAVAAGDGHSCAIVNGGLRCWGFNQHGQLGNGTTAASTVPMAVPGMGAGVTTVGVGRFHTCAVAGGDLRCWGNNGGGELGDGTTADATGATKVLGATQGTSVVTGGSDHTCAVVNGEAKCWGFNASGQLGTGAQSFSTVPTAVIQGAPLVVTGAASAIAADVATLDGAVTSNGAASSARFEVGATASYGTTVAAVQDPLPSNAAGARVSATIGGLACGTTYHYRAAATSAFGTGFGADAAFVTAPCPGAVATTTELRSAANPSDALVRFDATVIGVAPGGTVAFFDDVTPIAGCAAMPLTGAGNRRTATCATALALPGLHSIGASYSGDPGNRPSSAAPLAQLIVAPLPIVGTLVNDPYGGITVSNGSLVGQTITWPNATPALQLGPIAGAPDSALRIDFDAFHVGAGMTLTIRSGAPGQVVELHGAGAEASAIGGNLRAEGTSGAPPPVLHVWNPAGIAIAPEGRIDAPAGLALDTLGASWATGGDLVNGGTVDGGPALALLSGNIHGGGTFRGDAIRLHTFGSANHPVNGNEYLRNGLRLAPSAAPAVAITLNGYGTSKQVFNLDAEGDATLWMPSSWPASVSYPANGAVVMPGATRSAGAPDPAHGGGSMIVQASGSLRLVDGGTNDFVFPGAIVLKAGTTLDLNGVAVDQGWTTSGQAFQGLFFEAPSIVSPRDFIRVYGNDLNWSNFSTLPAQFVRAFTLKRNVDGSASFAASDDVAPHVNTYSVLQAAAVAGGCWVCLVNTQPVPMRGP